MTANEPLVTVVLVCYDHERFVEQALRSIFEQSYPHLELIVTDDASSDGSLAIVEGLLAGSPVPARLMANATNRGLCATLNQVLGLASGKYVAMMSADDWMEPDRVAVQVRAFEQLDEQFGLVHSDMFLVDVDGAPVDTWLSTYGEVVAEEAFVDLVRGLSFSTPSFMYRRSALEAAGPYDESLPAEDFDMVLRLARLTKFHFVPEPLVNWRMNPQSVSRQAGRLGRFEYCLPSLAKHFGRSAEDDRVISERMSTLATELYLGGRSRRAAAGYLRLAARRHPHRRAMAFAIPSTVGIPGPVTARVLETVGLRATADGGSR
jgi:glycosyltransferase involved in cell wall biosynthesis